MKQAPILHGSQLFRENVQVYINRSDEAYQDYMQVLHQHDFIEIAYVLSGYGIHQVGEQYYDIRPGDLFVINYDVPHRFFTKGAYEPVVFNCVFTPAFLDAGFLGKNDFHEVLSSYLFRNLFPENVQPSADLHLSGVRSSEIGHLFASMYTEYYEQKKGYSDIIRAHLITLLIKLFRILDEEREHAFSKTGTNATQTASTNRFHQELVQKALLYMSQHSQGEIRLEDVAFQSFVSKNYFSRLFHEVTGVRFSDHVLKLRMDEVVHLLQTTNKTVMDIAALCGFHDMKHFYASFRKHTGTTPGNIRQKAP